jgi:aspartyl-tRNA(Asn)/glutamyl-tRNA(Gln) amidotransferase subunit A
MSAEPRTITELSLDYRAGHLTSLQVTERCLQAVELRGGALNAFVTVFADEACRQAQRADAELAAGRDRGPLHGVPVSLKDLIDVQGAPTTAASRVRARHRAASDATVVARLREAGAVFIGKTNLHEFALGTTNEDSAYGPARHPIDPSRSAGGSSGGSAVSVAASMAYASIGSDTGGSIRIPSAACGLVGLKPTIGEIPTDGVVPLSPTLDHVGPMCRSVADAALVYATLRGVPDVQGPMERGADGLRLGVLGGYFAARLDPDVEAATGRACDRLRAASVHLRDVSLAHTSEIGAVYTVIALSEAAAYHAATLDAQGSEYTRNVRLRLESGRQILAEDYLRAMRGRAVLKAEVDAALTGLDGLVLPALAIPAFPLGRDTVTLGGTTESIRAVTLRLTQLFNLTGHPAITLPCGLTPQGLPVGLQIVGHHGRTADLLALARRVEPFVTPATGPGARPPSAS